MLSSSGSAQLVVVTTRRGTAVNKPAVVNSYNHNMNGVDVADQLTVFYSFVRKTRKWWRKLFFYLMEVSVVNSYLLYRQTVAQPRTHLWCRRALVEQVAKLSIQQAPPPDQVQVLLEEPRAMICHSDWTANPILLGSF